MTNSNEEVKNQFFTRVSEIPLVKAFCRTVASTYETTKNSNRLVGATFEKAEGYAKFANDQAEPLKKIFDRPLSTVSKIADKQLEELQRRFPSINTTPNQLLEYGQNLYQRSGVKTKIEDVSEAKNRSVATISDTGKYYRNRLVGSARNGQLALNSYVVGALDFSEGLVDKYVASPDGKKRSCSQKAQNSYVERVKCLSSKVVGGARYRATTSYDSIKGYTSHKINVADKFVKDSASSVNSSIQKAIADTNRVRQAVSNEIASRSHTITAKSDSAAVYLTQAVSNGFANISDRLISSAAPYLPEGVEKPAAAFVTYVHRWQDRVQQASSAGDIWNAALDETKQNIRLAKELLQSVLNNQELKVKDDKRW